MKLKFNFANFLLISFYMATVETVSATGETSGLGKLRKNLIITTWDEPVATDEGWKVLVSNGSPVDAIVEGCSYCERMCCRGTVGTGGNCDENGETTLDAMIMDGTTMDVGGVGALREIKEAIKVARMVLRHTEHSLLVGELATEFAVKMGFERTSLHSNKSEEMWKQWKDTNCQPNYWKNVSPDPKKHCGPYKPLIGQEVMNPFEGKTDESNHDTISMVAMDTKGNVAAGSSTNGLKFKISGRVGDSPIAGAGAYADSEVGGAAATGNGDVLMRFLPSFHIVELMRSGTPPQQAAEFVMTRMKKHYPGERGAVIALNIDGQFGAACTGYENFPFIVRMDGYEASKLFNVKCI